MSLKKKASTVHVYIAAYTRVMIFHNNRNKYSKMNVQKAGKKQIKQRGAQCSKKYYSNFQIQLEKNQSQIISIQGQRLLYHLQSLYMAKVQDIILNSFQVSKVYNKVNFKQKKFQAKLALLIFFIKNLVIFRMGAKIRYHFKNAHQFFNFKQDVDASMFLASESLLYLLLTFHNIKLTDFIFLFFYISNLNQLYNFASKKRISQIDRYKRDRIVLSKDGQYLVVINQNMIKVFNTYTSLQIGEMLQLDFNCERKLIILTQTYLIIQINTTDIIVTNIYFPLDSAKIKMQIPGTIIQADNSTFLVKSEQFLQVYSLQFQNLIQVIQLFERCQVFQLYNNELLLHNKQVIKIARSGFTKSHSLIINPSGAPNLYRYKNFIVNAPNLSYKLTLFHAGLRKTIRSINFTTIHYIQRVFIDNEIIIICSYELDGQIKLKQINCLKNQEIYYFFLNAASHDAIQCTDKSILIRSQIGYQLFRFE